MAQTREKLGGGGVCDLVQNVFQEINYKCFATHDVCTFENHLDLVSLSDKNLRGHVIEFHSREEGEEREVRGVPDNTFCFGKTRISACLS